MALLGLHPNLRGAVRMAPRHPHGDFLRWMRIRKNLSLTELWLHCRDVAAISSFSGWEGSGAVPGRWIVPVYARVLGCSIGELLGCSEGRLKRLYDLQRCSSAHSSLLEVSL
jgi:hypothetical protein